MKDKYTSLKNITPKMFSCWMLTCPAIYETKGGSYVIIGKLLRDKAMAGEQNFFG